MIDSPTKPIVWMGSAKKDLSAFPVGAKRKLGFALSEVQEGKMPNNAKPLHGFPGVSVMQISASDNTDAYRAVYTVRFADVVYVLHCFQKKSKRGVETPKADMDVIEARLKDAEEDYKRGI